MSPPFEFVAVADRGAVRFITMSSPGRANAVPLHGWGQLHEALGEFEASDQRALVLAGADGNFCAGADLVGDGALPDLSSVVANGRLTRQAGDAALALHRVSKPVVAAVTGLAVGAGMNLAIGCDIVVAAESARFAEIFVRRGLTMDAGGTWLLPRLVGLARARELALTGRVVGGAEAHTIGLVARVVPDDELESTAAALAHELAAGPPLALRTLKTALDRSSTFTFEQALSFEHQAQAILLASDDASEGVGSFVEKRTPEFEGR